jgi:hypothetical protein
MMKRSVVCLILALLFVWAGKAQEERQLVRVVLQQVNPPMLDEWVDLQKQYVDGAKAAGLPGRAVWQTLIGPTNQFTTAMLVDDLGYFDPDPQRPRGMSPADWQRWLARARRCTVSREVSVLTNYPELVIPGEIEGSRVQLVTFLENQPNKAGEPIRLLRDEVLPAYKKAGETSVYVSRVAAGQRGRVFVFRRVGMSFEGLGSAWIWRPVMDALGEEKGRELIDRVSPLIKSHWTHGMVLRKDLSFAQEK